MTNIIEFYCNFIVKIQEGVYTISANKRIQIILEYTDIRPDDIILGVKSYRSLLLCDRG